MSLVNILSFTPTATQRLKLLSGRKNKKNTQIRLSHEQLHNFNDKNFIQIDVNQGQQKKIVSAIKSKKGVTISIPHSNLRGGNIFGDVFDSVKNKISNVIDDVKTGNIKGLAKTAFDLSPAGTAVEMAKGTYNAGKQLSKGNISGAAQELGQHVVLPVVLNRAKKMAGMGITGGCMDNNDLKNIKKMINNQIDLKTGAGILDDTKELLNPWIEKGKTLKKVLKDDVFTIDTVREIFNKPEIIEIPLLALNGKYDPALRMTGKIISEVVLPKIRNGMTKGAGIQKQKKGRGGNSTSSILL